MARTPLAAGILGGLINFLGARQQGLRQRRYEKQQDAQDTERQADRNFQRQRLLAGDEEQKKQGIVQLVHAAQANNPTHAGEYDSLAARLMAGQAEYGPQHRNPGALAAGARSALQLPGMSDPGPVTIPDRVSLDSIPQGPNPYELQQRMAALKRQQELEDEQAKHDFATQLAERQARLRLPKEAMGALQDFLKEGRSGAEVAPILRQAYPDFAPFAPGSPNRVIPGRMPGQALGAAPPVADVLARGLAARQLPPQQTIGDDPAIDRLRQMLRGVTPIAPALGTLNQPEPDRVIPGRPGFLETLGQAPKVQADLRQSDAAIAASNAAEAASRASTENTRVRTQDILATQPARVKKLLTDVTRSETAVTETRARIAYLKQQGESINRRDELAALKAASDIELGRGNLALGRDRLATEQGKFDAEAPLRDARTQQALSSAATSRQQLAKLNPATQAKVKGLDQRIGRLEGQINRLRSQDNHDAADALDKNLLDLIQQRDDTLNAPGAVQRGAPAIPKPKVTGGSAARGRFITRLRSYGYTQADAERKADNSGL